MLFSDWGHSGRRDLRVSNDRHYYLDGEEQLWRIAAGRAADARTPRPTAGSRLQIWGMGIASQDLTGDGLPEVFLTSQADNKLQTLGRTGAARSDLPTDIALERGHGAAALRRRRRAARRRPGIPEFADVNNDGLADLLVTKGNVEAQLDQASRDPSNLFIGQPGRLVRRSGARQPGSSTTSGRAARRSSTSTSTACSTSSSSTGARTSTLWRNVGRGDAERARRRWATGSTCGCSSRRRTSTPSARGSTCGPATARRTREVTVGGGHVSGELGWLHTGIGSADEAEVRVQWPDGTVGPWMTVPAGERVTIVRGETAPRPWTPEG